MSDVQLVAVEVPEIGDERRKNWAKVVANVDESHSSGWAYEGEFIATGGVQDVPVGSVILIYGERGSRNSPSVEARVYVVNNDGTISLRDSAKGRAWARTLRDGIADLLEEQAGTPISARDWHPDLVAFSDAALREELQRRGLD